MNRRSFLAFVGGISVAGFTPSRWGGDTYRGFRLYWLDWRQCNNQALTFGAWVARLGDAELLYATTLGSHGTIYEMQPFDCSLTPQGVWISPWADTPERRAQGKGLALRELKGSIDRYLSGGRSQV